MILFRCVEWDVLRQHPEIIIEGGTLDQVGAGSANFNSLSRPCSIGECDRFLVGTSLTGVSSLLLRNDFGLSATLVNLSLV